MEVWTQWLCDIPIVGTEKTTVEDVSALCLKGFKAGVEPVADIKGQKKDAVLKAIEDKGLEVASRPVKVNIRNDLIPRLTRREVQKGSESTASSSSKDVKANIRKEQPIRRKRRKPDTDMFTKGHNKDEGAKRIRKRGSEATASSSSGAVTASIQGGPIHGAKRRSRPSNLEKPETKRAKRGEHVINNNVLKVFRKIIDTYCKTEGIDAACRLQEGKKVYEAYHIPLPRLVSKNISTTMVADIPSDVNYIDANSTIYGESIQNLINSVLFYMRTYYQDFHSKASSSFQKIDEELNESVYQINKKELYVDEIAKYYWLQEEGANEEVFEQAKKEVVKMFQRLTYNYGGKVQDEGEVLQWVRELHDL